MNCFDIQCVVEASSSRFNNNMTLERKENYQRHTKTVQNSLGFMPEVKLLQKGQQFLNQPSKSRPLNKSDILFCFCFCFFFF